MSSDPQMVFPRRTLSRRPRWTERDLQKMACRFPRGVRPSYQKEVTCRAYPA